MNDELQQKIMSLIDGAETVIPEVAQEYLAWGIVSNYFALCLGAIVTALAIIVWRKYKSPKDAVETDNFPAFMGMIILPLVAIPLIIFPVLNIIKIKTAPKVYLIDALRSK